MAKQNNQELLSDNKRQTQAETENPFLKDAAPFRQTKKQSSYLFFKRLLDIIFSFIALILLSIPFIIISIAIKLDSKGPVIFKQSRYGRYGKPFTILKFRTMYQDAPSAVATGDFKDAQLHVTKVGRILRKASIDELPQLFNVLFGQMSIIGPRPLIVEEEKIHQYRLANQIYMLRPGITGYAQVNGRDDISFEDKMARELEYLHNFSFSMDLKILFKTVYVVFHREGVRY